MFVQGWGSLTLKLIFHPILPLVTPLTTILQTTFYLSRYLSKLLVECLNKNAFQY